MMNINQRYLKSGIYLIVLLLLQPFLLKAEANLTEIKDSLNFQKSDSSYLIFTPGNWNIVQTAILPLQNGPRDSVDLAHAIISSDPEYDLIMWDTAFSRSSEKAGIIIHPRTEIVTREAGGKVQLRLKLTTKPRGKVTLELSISRKTEGLLSKNIIHFDSTNWNRYENITVQGQDDSKKDGDQKYSINFLSTAAFDMDYNGIIIKPLDLINIDDDGAKILCQPPEKLTTFESDEFKVGELRAFYLSLTSKPGAEVNIKFKCSNLREGTISSISASFNRENWNIPQEIFIKGKDDQVDDDDQDYKIIFSASQSLDPKFNKIKLKPINLINIDDDTAGVIIEPLFLKNKNAPFIQSYNVVLSSEPYASVKILKKSLIHFEGSVWPPYGRRERKDKTRKHNFWFNALRLISISGLILVIYNNIKPEHRNQDLEMGLPPNFPVLPPSISRINKQCKFLL